MAASPSEGKLGRDIVAIQAAGIREVHSSHALVQRDAQIDVAGRIRGEGCRVPRSRLIAAPIQVKKQCSIPLRAKRELEKGRSATSIAKQFNAEGTPSPEGAEWTQQSLWRTLCNPFYAGMNYRNRSRAFTDPRSGKRMRIRYDRSEWKLGRGKHELLWSLDDYHNILRIRQERAEGGGPHKTPTSMHSRKMRWPRAGASGHMAEASSATKTWRSA